MKKFIFYCLMFISASSMLSAEAIVTWRVQGNDAVLESSTNLQNPSLGKTAVLAVTYEKSLFRCKPSVAFLSFEGLKLGVGVKQQSSKKTKNQLTFHVNNKKFVAQKETKMNTYSNGIELVAFFNKSILNELSKPSLVKVSVGNNRPLIEFRTTNSIKQSIRQISGLCK